MLKEYRTIESFGRNEIIIEKSTFIGYAKPVTTEEEALAFIKEIKTKHKDATHNVPAYVIGPNNEIQRCNDDGEPSGTAGVPILEVIKKENLRDVVVVVTRYFGGIKLGAGGLVRAYTKGAKIALEAGRMITKQLYQVMQLTVEYTMLGMIQNQLRIDGFEVKDTVYDEQVHVYIYVLVDEVPIFKEKAIQWTNSRCQIVEHEAEYKWV